MSEKISTQDIRWGNEDWKGIDPNQYKDKQVEIGVDDGVVKLVLQLMSKYMNQ